MELLIFIGLQGAGKSTFYRSRFAQTHRHISKDKFPNARNREKRQQTLLREAFEQGASVVVDNTNVTRADRARLIVAGQSAGARVIGYYFESQIQECLARNSQREGKARVPDVALYVTANRLELPSYEEGFAQLFHVRCAELGEFLVDVWQEKPARAAENGTGELPTV
jgi:predicted kinase